MATGKVSLWIIGFLRRSCEGYGRCRKSDSERKSNAKEVTSFSGGGKEAASYARYKGSSVSIDTA